MKKILALLLAVMMLLSFAACNKGDDPDPSGTNNNDLLSRDPGTTQGNNQGNTENTDLASLLSGIGTSSVVYGKLDEATKQQLKSAFESEGVSVTFGIDGSMTVVEADGSTITQNANGTWAFSDDQGNQGAVGNNWPDNDFTKLVPEPDFVVSLSLEEENRCAISFANSTVEDLRAYAEQLKSAGFTVDAETVDEENFGTWVYTYTARDSNGYEVELTGVAGTSSLIISKE